MLFLLLLFLLLCCFMLFCIDKHRYPGHTISIYQTAVICVRLILHKAFPPHSNNDIDERSLRQAPQPLLDRDIKKNRCP